MEPKKRPPAGIRKISDDPLTFQVRVSLGRDPTTGKYVEWAQNVRGNLTAAKKLRAEMLSKPEEGRRRRTAVTVNDLLDEWLADLTRLKRSPNTIYGYAKECERYIRPRIGMRRITDVTRKTLVDEVIAPMAASDVGPHVQLLVKKTLSSAFSYACFQCDYLPENPALRLRLPPVPDSAPVVPTPEECRSLIDVAAASSRPEMARVYFLAATTGARRGEICGWRRADLDAASSIHTVGRNIVAVPGHGRQEKSTKNRRARPVAVDPVSMEVMAAQLRMVGERAVAASVSLVPDPYLFSDQFDASAPWRPDMITHIFTKHRRLAGLDHLVFKGFRRFMTTYGQMAGFSLADVAIRAGNDPAVAAKHYTGRVAESDFALAGAVAALLGGLDR